MPSPVPTPVAAALGLVPTVLGGVRRLPGRVLQLPVLYVSTTLTALDAARREYDDLAERGERLIARLRGQSFDELEDRFEDRLQGTRLAKPYDAVEDALEDAGSAVATVARKATTRAAKTATAPRTAAKATSARATKAAGATAKATREGLEDAADRVEGLAETVRGDEGAARTAARTSTRAATRAATTTTEPAPAKAAKATKKATKKAAKKAADTATAAADTAQRTAEQVADTGAAAAGKAAKSTGKTADKVADKAGDVAAKGAEQAAGTAQQAADRAGDAAGAVQEQLPEAEQPKGAPTPKATEPDSTRVDTAASADVVDTVESVADRVGGGEVLPHDELPLPDYDHMTLGSLRGRMRSLTIEQLVQVRDYEKAHADRLPIVTMLDNRIAKLATDASQQPSGVPSDRPAPGQHDTRTGSMVSPATGGPAQNPPSQGVPTNPAQPRTTGSPGTNPNSEA